MPYRATRLETAYRIAPVRVFLLNDRNQPEEVTLNVKYRPLSLAKLEEWEAISKNGHKTVEVKEGEEVEEKIERDVLARQLSEVVIDLDLVEDDDLTPRKPTLEYLKTLDLGFLKDIKAVIEERAFPEKKELMAMIRSRI